MPRQSSVTLESFFRAFNITDFDLHPDEKQLVYSTNIDGNYNLWALDLPSTYPYPLTTINQMSSFIRFGHDGTYLLAGFDNDGDENWQIVTISAQGGAARPVLSQPQEKFYFGDLSRDGHLLYYYTSVDNPNYHNLCCLDLRTNESEVLRKGSTGPLSFLKASPSDRSYTYLQSLGNTKVLGYLQTENEQVLLTPDSDSNHRVRAVEYWDEETLFLLTNYQAEFSYLASFSIPNRHFREEICVPDHEFKEMVIDKHGKRIFLVAERGVMDRLYVYHLSTKSLQELDAPVDVISRLRVSESGTLYLLGRSSTSLANIYQSTNGKEWTQLTNHRIMGVRQSELSDPDVLHYPSFDGKTIEALHFRPAPYKDNGHTVLYPHGGPQSVDKKLFRPLVQYLCYSGYRVFCANYRGSSGYGESFMSLVNRDWGKGPRLDLVAGMKWLNEQGKSEAGKWFCVGGSYGGYMSLLLHGRHAQMFKAFVDQFGPSNLFTTIETAPAHWKANDAELIGDVVRDKEKLIEDSPLTYLDGMVKPMLVVQGVNDPRVVKVESDAVVEALRHKGRDVEYLVLEDEGHGYSKTENAIKVYKTIVEFLNRYLAD